MRLGEQHLISMHDVEVSIPQICQDLYLSLDDLRDAAWNRPPYQLNGNLPLCALVYAEPCLALSPSPQQPDNFKVLSQTEVWRFLRLLLMVLRVMMVVRRRAAG
jgi:hypothetical protein